MDPFYDIWKAGIFKGLSCGNGCIVVIVGLISMIFGTCTATDMPLCNQTESKPCVLRYGETIQVCAGDGVYTNMTLIVDSNIIPQNVSISVQGYQFSKGPVVSGQFHNGDEHIDRWTNKISFQGNTMTYEIWNLKTESGDEFECHMEIDIEGDKFKSEHFKWFHVESDNCITKPPDVNDTTEVSIQRTVNCSDHEGLDTQNNRLDTMFKMMVAVLVLLFTITVKLLIPTRVQKGLQNKFSGLFDHIGCHKLSSSSTSVHSTVPSQSFSSLASMNEDEFSLSYTSDNLSQSSSSLASMNQDEYSPLHASNNLSQSQSSSLARKESVKHW